MQVPGPGAPIQERSSQGTLNPGGPDTMFNHHVLHSRPTGQ